MLRSRTPRSRAIKRREPRAVGAAVALQTLPQVRDSGVGGRGGFGRVFVVEFEQAGLEAARELHHGGCPLPCLGNHRARRRRAPAAPRVHGERRAVRKVKLWSDEEQAHGVGRGQREARGKFAGTAHGNGRPAEPEVRVHAEAPHAAPELKRHVLAHPLHADVVLRGLVAGADVAAALKEVGETGVGLVANQLAARVFAEPELAEFLPAAARRVRIQHAREGMAERLGVL